MLLEQNSEAGRGKHKTVFMFWYSGFLAVNHVGVAVQQLAEELRVIADQFDQQVVAQATQGLRRKISAISSPDVSLS